MTILIVIFSIISLLVIHELGHFLVAKKFGVKIEEFGVGIPPKLFSKKFGETLYSINLLPIGAFVKMYGEEEHIKDPRSFTGKPIWQRSLIVLGGVISFWIIGGILLTIVFGIGIPQVISDNETGDLVNPKVQILAVSSGSPAEQANIEIGDTITKLTFGEEGELVSKTTEVQEFTDKHKGEEVVLTIKRGSDIVDISLIPRVSFPEDDGPMGISLVRTAEVSYPWWQAPIKGIGATVQLTGTIIATWGQIISNLVHGEGLPAGVKVVGPIGIGSLMTQAAQSGVNYFLQFIAIIALYLAVFNILPIPALDGGKMVFLIVEKIKKSPVDQKIEQKITAGFFFVLIALMIWITVRDVINLF